MNRQLQTTKIINMDEDYYLKPYKNILDSCVEFLKGHCNSSCTIDHVDFHRYFIFLFKYKARDNTNNIKLTQIIKKPIFQLQLAAVPPKFIHMIHSFFLQNIVYMYHQDLGGKTMIWMCLKWTIIYCSNWPFFVKTWFSVVRLGMKL